MTDPNDSLACKFTAGIEKAQGRYVVEIPETEIDYGTPLTDRILNGLLDLFGDGLLNHCYEDQHSLCEINDETNT